MTGKRIIWIILAVVLVLGQPGNAWMMYSTDEPDTGLIGNSFVDILYHEGTIWLASGQGLGYSTNGGFSWFTRTMETNPGLVSDEPSALFGRPGQVWMAGSHFEPFEGINYPFGDGFSMSSDNGNTWENYAPPEASNFAKLAYDLAGTDSSTYAACFYGGFIVRHDPDTVWEHIFYSSADSVDWAADQWPNLETGRYYSCAVDTTHADTLVVYGGSARGINKFIYLPKRIKMGGQMIYDIIAAGSYVYFAHEGGVTQGDTTTLGILYTADTSNGLGSNWIRKLKSFGGKLWAAAFDPADSSGLGLYTIDNPDAEWVEIGQSVTGPSDLWVRANAGLFEGHNGGVYDFRAYQDSVLFIAAGDSGAYMSLDSGQTWNRFFVDPLDTDLSSPRNQVYSIDISPDSMFFGTRAGLVVTSYSDPMIFDFDTLVTFAESDTSGSMVSLVRHLEGASGSFTYVGVEPQTDSGFPGVIFLDPDTTFAGPDTTVYMRGTLMLWHTILNDIIVSEVQSVLASDFGLFYSINQASASFVYPYEIVDLENGQTLDAFRSLSAEFINDLLFTGSSGGYGFGEFPEGENVKWHVALGNTNPKKHDLAVALTNQSTGLPGNWVVAIDVQNIDTVGVLWAACRRVPDTLEQYNSVGISFDYGDTWQRVLTNEQIWNFAFDSHDTAYAAASAGLFAAGPPYTDWQRQAIVDPITMDTIVAETEVFAVEVADDVLWVGTELGLARKNLHPDSTWDITRIFKETESSDDVFAAPVPFSPLSNNGRLSLHYHVDAAAEVTVEIYDFAMNLVRVVADNKYREGDADYFETWDGYNGRGDMVAVGIYHFKVEYSTGQIRWGRLAIIP